MNEYQNIKKLRREKKKGWECKVLKVPKISFKVKLNLDYKKTRTVFNQIDVQY